MRKFLLLGCFAVAVGSLFTNEALAQAGFPEKPIKLVVPFAAGGGNDSVARILADALGRKLGQAVIVDNKAGAGGNIGTDFVAKAPADGYTLVHVANTVVMNPSLYKKLPFDIEKDLAPVALVATSPILLLSERSSSVDSLQSLVQQMKGDGKKLSYATPGVGTPHHFAMELMVSKLNSSPVHVAYKGAGPAVTDVLAGQVPLLLATPQSVVDFIASGRLRLLATMEPSRTSQFKDTPTVAEVLPGFNVSIWHGLMAPASTPKPVLVKLSEALEAVLADRELQSRLQAIGFQPNYQAPAAMAKRISEEVPTWKKVAADARIVPE